ncbi:hypothetical protein HY629_00015 [Candidatus Uhrbacteria bacterium]|nr:hypothetical protein [Candidatus Doudnabacteria bacterium]MBI4276216.1 hypothetical protein [Candidatus Uhrbacteria bacterium]
MEDLRKIQERIRSSGAVTITMRQTGDSYWFALVIDRQGVMNGPREVAFAANLINRAARAVDTAQAMGRNVPPVDTDQIVLDLISNGF